MLVVATLAGVPLARAVTPASTLERLLAEAKYSGVVIAADATGITERIALGLADRANATPIHADMIWRWASVTKQVTAVLVMQQVDAGKLSLDMTLAQALPSFKGEQAARISIRHLLQHTSGLPNPDDSPTRADGVPEFYRDAAGADAHRYCARPSKHVAGSRFEYNNCDYLLLGSILERATSRTYAQLVRERIAVPSGLKSVAVVDTTNATRSRVIGYRADGRPEAKLALASFAAAGAIERTASDMLAFNAALIDGKLLSATSR